MRRLSLLSADISAAHRRVKIRREDWHLLACKSSSASEVVWVNKVGTFGISSAPYYWTRLFGLVGRLGGKNFATRSGYIRLYMLTTCIWFLRDYVSFWFCGLPLLHTKFLVPPLRTISSLVVWCASLLGMSWITSQLRLASLANVANGCSNSWRVSDVTITLCICGNVQSSWGGFLSCAGCYFGFDHTWRRCTLGALHLVRARWRRLRAWVKLTCRYLESQLSIREFLFSCKWPLVLKGDAFRTDAKCVTGRIVFGGHCLLSGAWFSLEVDRSVAPFMFKENGESQWASTTAELVAVIFCSQGFWLFRVWS